MSNMTESNNNNELKCLEFAYRAVDYEYGHIYTCLSDDDKKLFNETLKYLNTLMDNVKQQSMWIARDEDGSLRIYNDEPIRSCIDDKWTIDFSKTLYDECMAIDDDLFPELKWEDEPLEIKLIKRKRK